MLIYNHGKRVLWSMLACIAAISFPFQSGEQASKRASEKWGEVGRGEVEGEWGGEKKEYSSHSLALAVSFPSVRAFFWKRLLRKLGRCRLHFTYTGVPRWPSSAKNTPRNTIKVIFEN